MSQISKLVLIVNLGSAAALEVKEIRKFLRAFLSDKRVVGLPRIFWLPILYGIILPLRAKKLLAKYRQIWLATNSSPLVAYTKQQSILLQERFSEGSVKVDYAFCYGQRNIAEQLQRLSAEYSFQELIVIPLYPQYSSSTTAAVFDLITKFYAKSYLIPSLKFIHSYATHPLYIQAIAAQVTTQWANFGRSEKLIVSFHSIPLKLVAKGDSYLRECQASYTLLCQELGLDPLVDAKLVFQSKFGRAKWLEPSTAATLAALAKAEVMSVDVICPGFVSDCLETLEEVSLEYRKLFIANGGKRLNYIPCLNASTDLTNLLAALIGESY